MNCPYCDDELENRFDRFDRVEEYRCDDCETTVTVARDVEPPTIGRE